MITAVLVYTLDNEKESLCDSKLTIDLFCTLTSCFILDQIDEQIYGFC